MEKYYTQQEILLVTGTTLTSGELCKKDEAGQDGHQTEKEKLQEACWNGLVRTMLPEISLQTANGGILCIWEIKEAGSFLELDLGEIPAAIDKHFSITPHNFLCMQSYN
ncbi:hypothetical protein Q4E93_12385 [Flavitalea sp. BT771]|uniref:hypothetical protein n=1 Tax=Flavitalea sp. BT771 TaxID=3063329 RepID=UPI0026E1DE97|nr:hypothetical protein [Flavitalea sp. BT771]MDO6431393.1 hypothetical protein [Flavitalea sp. BT771]MDV6220301.1 hypothetical protein [Flavitalea sp. BT771]